MSSDELPPLPPEGQKRYKAFLRNPKDNPFRPQGVPVHTQTVDVDESIPISQVEDWTRESAQQLGYTFIRVETVA